MPRHRRTEAGSIDSEAFARALERIREASGLPWKELARLLGTSTLNLWRWRNGVHPNMEHFLVLQELAADLGLDDLSPPPGTDRRA
ncbi:MAG: helix-turn-helix transcriptional regulator [Chloroflexi bacterium]|nr:helix-turn-helix transcriptional regulator [Chloroflexota bacterium]